MKRILIVTLSNVTSDSRVLRQIQALSSIFEIDVIARGKQITGVKNFYPIPIFRVSRNKLQRKVLKVLLLLTRKYKRFYFVDFELETSFQFSVHAKDYDLILANDFESLPFISICLDSKAPIVLDAHEYYFDEINKVVRKRIFSHYRKWTSEIGFQRVIAMSSVSSEIVKLYQRRFESLEIQLVRNIPAFNLRAFESRTDEQIQLIHHGAAVPNRGLLELLELVSYLDQRFTLNLMLIPTDPKFLKHLEQLAAIYGKRVNFLIPTSPEEIVKSISGADLGIHLLPPLSLNNKFALPNKFFEFLQAHLGVVIGPSPEMQKIVTGCELGVIADSFHPFDVARKINNLSRNDVEFFRARSKAASEVFCWEKESEILRAFVSKRVAL